MPKRSPAEQLDLAINSVLARTGARHAASPGATTAQLVKLVRPLRDLPRPEFKARLKSELQRRISMKEAVAPSTKPEPPQPRAFRRPNFPNIAPYFLVPGAAKFIDFLVAAFEGREQIRVPNPDGSIMHAAVAIGNSVIELGDANAQYPQRVMTTHLYVPDADATYARALAAGATSVYAPTDEHPSGDRWGEAKDMFGNTWYIATRRSELRSEKSRSAAEEPLAGAEAGISVQPYLHLLDAAKMIPFIEAALGAQATGVHTTPDGVVLHATIEIAGATFEIDEARPGAEPTKSYLHAYVPDTDALYARAVAAGAKGVTPPYTAPYGERSASIEDPFGNTWFLATFLGERGA
ncbi:MAG TPA: VOC family protein [Candidatus Acidoferrum sp.]|nr:VOC family protein [Candidatus Acidoferrum sp.]